MNIFMRFLLLGEPAVPPEQQELQYTGPAYIAGYSYKMFESPVAGITLKRDGRVEVEESIPDSTDSMQQVLSYYLWSTNPGPNVGQDYEIRFTDINNSHSMNPGVYGVWLGLEVDRRNWMVISGPGSLSQQLKVEIRHRDFPQIYHEFVVLVEVTVDAGAT